MTWSDASIDVLRTECDEFMRSSNAASVAVIDRTAGTLVLLGDVHDLNLGDIHEYISAHSASTLSDELRTRPDDQGYLLLGPLLKDSIVVVGFDDRTSLGLVRLRLRRLRSVLRQLGAAVPPKKKPESKSPN